MGQQRRNTAKKKCAPRWSHQNKKQSLNECTLDEIQVCANCCSPVSSSTSKTHETPSNSSQQQSSSHAKNVVGVDEVGQSRTVDSSTCDSDLNEMISTIYNLDFIPRLLAKYPDAVWTDTITEATDFPLCFLCTNLLKSFFLLYSQFNQLRKIESLLSRQINSLNLLINYDSQNQSQQLNHMNQGKDDESRETSDSNSMISDIDNPQDTITTTTTSSSRVEFHSTDPEPCVSVEIDPLDDLTVEDIGYAPPSLLHLYQDASQGASNSTRRKEMANQAENDQQRTTTNCHSNSTKLEFSSNDRGPWVKVGPRLEDLTVEEVDPDHAPLTPPKLEQETPQSNLEISNVHSITPVAEDDENTFSDGYHDNDNDIDNEASLQLDEDEDVKPDVSDLSPRVTNGNEKNKHDEGPDNFDDRTNNTNAESNRKRAAPGKFVVNSKKRKQVQRDRNFACTVVINDAGQVCPFRTITARYLRNHMLSVHAEEKDKVKCGQCDKVFKNKLCLKGHNFKKHTEKGRKPKDKEHPCTIVNKNTGQVCPFRARYAHSLKSHMLCVHAEEKDKVKCGECDREFKSKFHLKEHIHRIHTDKYRKPENAQVSCTFIDEAGQVCPYRGFPSNLSRHKISVHAQEKDKVKCDECNQEFKSQFRFKDHFRRFHTEKGRKLYKLQLAKEAAKSRARTKEMNARDAGKVCPHCGIDFGTKAKCTLHRRTVHDDYAGETRKCVACELCEKKFGGHSRLKIHMQHVHSDERPFECDECGGRHKSKRSLYMHKSKCHDEEKRQQRKLIREEEARKRADIGNVCPHCGIDFITRKKCTIHRMKVHDDYTGTKKIYVCEHCGKKCTGHYGHKVHMQHAHSDARPYICDECGLSYKSPSNLLTHKSRYHTEEGKQKYNDYQRENLRRKKLIKEQEARKEEDEMEAETETSESDEESEQTRETPVITRSSTSSSSPMLPPPPVSAQSNIPTAEGDFV